jgi:hypothetical protein
MTSPVAGGLSLSSCVLTVMAATLVESAALCAWTSDVKARENPKHTISVRASAL